MKIKKILMTVAMCFFVAFAMGCEPTIDASSDEALEASSEEMTEGMSESEAEEFAGAVFVLSLYLHDKHDGDEDAALEELDGMSVSDIENLLEELDDELD